MGRLWLLALVLLPLTLLGAGAEPQRRVALVIGNGSYAETAPLANPANDAADMAAKLRGLGFEVVEGVDLEKRALERRIGEFSDALRGARVGLFFYAGHGLQIDGRNYIVPVDARLDDPVKLRFEALPMDEILDIMEQRAPISLAFLDACRNNPFARSLGTTSRSAAPLSGLAKFDEARGSFIAFSTAPGKVAMDGAGRNSPFATALLRHIGTPGQGINDIMIEVRKEVLAATGDFQRPWEQGSLLERFEFAPAGGAASPPAVAMAATEAPAAETATVARSVADPAEIERFLREGYLAPDATRMRETVQALYADRVTVYGSPLDLEALVKIKLDWFGQWTSWTLALDPQSLSVAPGREGRTDVAFSMSYDYVPKSGAARVAGRAKIFLELAPTDKGWRIVSERSEGLN